MEQRRLSAIMFTDIAGYTGIMAADEKLALWVINRHREILKPIIEKHNGNWLKEMGDGTLSSFPSTIQSVNCAIEIQESLRQVAEFKIRIGIHLGDIVFTENDIYGDGVNVASRIEATAIAGGIAISGQVYDTRAGYKEIQTKYLGEVNLKNVTRPVRIYSISNSELPTADIFPATNNENVTGKLPIAELAAVIASPQSTTALKHPDATNERNSLFQELKRRNVFRVGSVYILVAWILVQVTTAVLPVFNAPLWVNQVTVLLLIIGLPVVLVIAWAFELTPEGLKITEPGSAVPTQESDYVLSGLLVLLIGFLMYQQFDSNSPTSTNQVADSATEIGQAPESNLIVDRSNNPNPETIAEEPPGEAPTVDSTSLTVADDVVAEAAPASVDVSVPELIEIVETPAVQVQQEPAANNTPVVELTTLPDQSIQSVTPAEELPSTPVIEVLTSIAILPLPNLSSDPDNAYFAAGMHEEILNQLAKVSNIRVLSRRSVLKYENTTENISAIARELNVATIMEGSVRFAGNRVRITCQLIRVSDDSHIWSETYDRELEDIFEIQSDVALKVARAMQASLMPEEIDDIERVPTQNAEAYGLYLQSHYRAELAGLSLGTETDGWIQAGIEDMRRAIELDPMFAEAYSDLAYLQTYNSFGMIAQGRDLETEALAAANARKAIELDPKLSRPYGVLAVLAAIDRRWPEFESHVQQALAHPNLDSRTYSDLTLAYTTAQLYEPATRMLELAIRYDPESVEIRRLAMMVNVLTRDYDSTLRAAEDFRALNGNDNAYHVYRATALHFLEREMESFAELDAIGDDLNTEDVGFYPFYGYLFCRRGEVAKVEALALQQQLFNQASLMMGCRLGSGNLDSVFDFLEFMMQTGIVIPDLGEALDELRAAPRYAAIKAYLNLPEPN